MASIAREEQPRIPHFNFGVGQKQTHVVSIFHGSVYDSAREVVQEIKICPFQHGVGRDSDLSGSGVDEAVADASRYKKDSH